MVAAQHHRRHAFAQASAATTSAALGAGVGDLLQIARVRFPETLGFGNRDGDIAAVVDRVAQRLQPGFKSGNPHRRGPHIHAAARLAQIQRYAKDADLPTDAAWTPLHLELFASGAMTRVGIAGLRIASTLPCNPPICSIVDATDRSGSASARKESSPAHAPGRRSRPPRARCPCQSRSAEPNHTAADQDTTGRPRVADWCSSIRFFSRS